MKRWRMVAVLCLVASAAVWAGVQSGGSQRTVEDELVKMEREWLEAETKGDVASLDRMYAEDFIGTTPDGNVVFKEDVVPSAEMQGRSRLPKCTLKESVVRVWGTTSVVMGLVAVGDAVPSGQLRFTKVYLKRDGAWKCVALHLQRLAPPAP